MKAKELRAMSDELFTKRNQLMTLWQEVAENFYPERSDFTLRRQMGSEFASHLQTSFPVQCRRDLGDQVGSMLRPSAKEWFNMARADEQKLDNDAKKWLERSGSIMRRAMYDRVTKFTEASKQGDNDYVTFGQTVKQARLNQDRSALLYRTHHLRDVVWMEDDSGEICFVARRWKPYARDVVRKFKNAHVKVKTIVERKPFEEIDCLHIMCKTDMYDGAAGGRPWFSIHYDTGNEWLMEEVAQWNKEYIIERWQTVSGGQYAYSPATIVALPDARLLQAMTYTLLEAGEKIVNPPMVATEDVVRSDVAIYAGGITWVDRDYDERLGEALRPMTTDSKGMPLSRDMQGDLRDMLIRGFYLNKLSLPQSRPEMTAFEVGQYVQQYIRDALPLFEPMEQERNGQICETTFDILWRAGAFGSVHDMPKSLRGANIIFRFESPLHDAIESQKSTTFQQMGALIAQAAQLDPSAAALPDIMVALRDAMRGSKVPEAWMRSEVSVQDTLAAQKAAAETQQQLAAMEQASVVAKNVGQAQAAGAQAMPELMGAEQ
jgi:hypothetical protein